MRRTLFSTEDAGEKIDEVRDYTGNARSKVHSRRAIRRADVARGRGSSRLSPAPTRNMLDQILRVNEKTRELFSYLRFLYDAGQFCVVQA